MLILCWNNTRYIINIWITTIAKYCEKMHLMEGFRLIVGWCFRIVKYNDSGEWIFIYFWTVRVSFQKAKTGKSVSRVFLPLNWSCSTSGYFGTNRPRLTGRVNQLHEQSVPMQSLTNTKKYDSLQNVKLFL